MALCHRAELRECHGQMLRPSLTDDCKAVDFPIYNIHLIVIGRACLFLCLCQIHYSPEHLDTVIRLTSQAHQLSNHKQHQSKKVGNLHSFYHECRHAYKSGEEGDLLYLPLLSTNPGPPVHILDLPHRR